MNQINLHPTHYKKFFKMLVESEQNFLEIETKKTRYIKLNKTKYYSDPNPPVLNIFDLGIISKTVKEIRKNINSCNLENNIKKDYFQAIREPYIYENHFYEGYIRKNKIIECEAVQIDLNAAYLTAVKNRKLISEKTYNDFFITADDKNIKKLSKNRRNIGHNGEVLKYSKDSRLVAVGTLAQDKIVTEFKAGKKSQTYREYNETEANVFWTAAADVGKTMINVLNSCNGFFCWVDAVFIPREYFNKAAKLLKESGYNFHTKEIYIYQNGNNFKSIEKDTGEIKQYNVPSGKISTIIEELNSENFINNILNEYKLLIEKTSTNKKNLNEALLKVLKSNYNLEDNITLLYLSEKCKKIGLLLSDVIKIKITIEETYRDMIFQNEVLNFIILNKIENLFEKIVLPPFYEEKDPEFIEREFYFDFSN